MTVGSASGGRRVTAASVAIVAGTALGFGAVYPWVYRPALLGCAVVAAFALRTGGRSRLREHAAFGGALFVVALAVAAQLVPLPETLRAALSPAAERVRSAGDLRYAAMLFASVVQPGAAARTGSTPLSIDPSGTATALAFLVVLGAFTLGLAVHLSRSGGPERLVPGIIGTGVLLVIVAVVQEATYTGRIYGFWKPESIGAHPFGPFVNRNHFAGWMIMAAPVALGYVAGLLGRSARGVKAGWHQRVLWCSSAAASRLMLAAVATGMLICSVVLTLSRSGIAGLFAAMIVVGIAGVRGRSPATRSTAVATGLVMTVVATAALGWVGADRTLQRFADIQGTDLSGRTAVWRDTMAIARDFPLVGSGLDTFATAIVSYETPGRPTLFSEAHNEYLQLASEGGLLVCVPALAALAIFIARVRRRFAEPRVSQMTLWIRVGAVAGLMAIAIQSLVDFSLQIPANAVLCSVLCAIALHREGAAVPGEPAGAGGARSIPRPLVSVGV